MRYELKKMLENKILLCGVILSVVFTLYSSYMVYYKNKLNEKDVKMNENYSECMGEYSEERVRLISEEYEKSKLAYEKYKEECELESGEKLEDDTLFQQFLKYGNLNSQISNVAEVNQYRETVKNNASRLKISDKKYIANVNSKIEKMYARELEFFITDGTQAKDITSMLDMMSYIDIINICLLIFVASSIFTNEHKKNTYPIIYSSYAGRRKIYIRKILCVCIFAVMMSLIAGIFSIMFTFFYGSTNEINQVIQSVLEFSQSPYDLNIWQLWILVTLLRMLGYVTIICIATMVAVCFKMSILPFAINVLLLVGGFSVSFYLEEISFSALGVIRDKYEVYQIFRKYTPFGIVLDGQGFFKVYEPINIFGYPISTLTITCLINVLLSCIVIAVGYKLYVSVHRKSGV
ncbi:MAG: hypothetical protein E7270_10670 [Lachnospiraceae bacterium]|nr:hypothetical protein [Lachnospiraceae bacterium]